MTILFDRSVELRVFADNQKITLVKPGEESLDIDFDVVTSSDKEPNRAKIIVYNLSETTRNLIGANHQGVELLAGYSGDTKLIFRGATTNVTHEKARPDWITTIYAGDGEKEYTTKIFNKSYSAGSLVFQILKDLAVAMEIPSEINFDEVTATLLKGESYSGRVKDVLDQVTKAYGLKWSVQQGVLEITSLLSPIRSQPTAVLLSVDTGMIGSPELIERQSEEENTKKRGRDKKETRIIGVRVMSLLNPEIRPGRLIKIEAQQTITSLGKLMEVKTPNVTANGVWRCDRAHYYGDNVTGPFDVEVEADILEQTI